eukprot:gene5098-8697_t
MSDFMAEHEFEEDSYQEDILSTMNEKEVQKFLKDSLVDSDFYNDFKDVFDDEDLK